MDEFMLKVLLSFLVGGAWITFSIVIAEKLGNKIGGIFLSLPSTTLVSMLFIGWTKGPDFAAQTAALAPFGMIPTGIFLFALILLMKKYDSLAFLLAFAIWFFAAIGIESIGGKSTMTGVAIYAAMVLVMTYFIEKRMDIKSVAGSAKKHTLRDILSKGIFAGGMVAASIVVAELVGPWWASIFATFPAATISSMYILLREKGADFAMATGKIILPASLNIIVYVVAISITYPIYGLVLGTILSYISAAIFAAIIYLLMKKFVK